jgi:5S rRNA maturation endonuclease (ribonuclease M5)
LTINEDFERLEQVEVILEEIKQLAAEGAVIIVEGRRDRQALKELGIEGKVVLATHHPLLDFAEDLARGNKKIILLTDWDRSGNELAAKISEYLRASGRAANTDLREKLRNLVQKKVKDIEGLSSFITNLRYELHGITK